VREQARCGGDGQPLGMAVVLRQGLGPWLHLAAAQPAERAPAARESISSLPPCPPASVQRDLVAAWTNLILGKLTNQETHS
jgi:hypothetical protein